MPEMSPSSTAVMISRNAVAAGCAFLGVYLAFFIDSAPAPTIVLLMTIVFLLAFARTRLEARKIERSAT